MPTVTLNRAVVEELVGKRFADDELKDRISMLGTDLENVSEEEIVVEIFPNRPDLLSEQGFARALSSFVGEKIGLREYDVKVSGEKVVVDKSAEEVRGNISCALVKGLSLSDEKIKEIIQIQEKLHGTYGRNRKKCAIGIYPLDVIELPIRYGAEEPKKIKFTPLEAEGEMDGESILAEHPTGKAYAHLLEGKTLYPAFRDGAGKVLSLPPIINSHDTGRVVESTTDVFVECSGHDQAVVDRCLAMVVSCLSDMGGQIESIEVVYPGHSVVTPNFTPRKMTLDVPYVNKRLGLDLTQEAMQKLLEKMGFGIAGEDVLIPAWRDDIMHQVDLVEDIAIAYGYENFTPAIPNIATVGAEDDFAVFEKKIIGVLCGLGLLEMNTYHIANEEVQNKKMGSDVPLVTLANALNTEYTVLRGWMLPEMLAILGRNKHHAYPQNIFDSGVVFKEKDGNVEEFTRVGCVFAHEKADYTQARSALQEIFRALGLECSVEQEDHPSFIPGRCARVKIDGEGVAYCGEIAPSVLNAFDLQVPVSGFELNLSVLFEKLNTQ